MKLLLECYSSNENYNGGCDFAFVDLTPELAAIALRRIADFAQLKMGDAMALEIYYWDDSCDWIETSEKIQELTDGYSGDVVEAESFEPTKDSKQRTECDQMIVEEYGIRWTAIPKHTDVYVTTLTIPVEMIVRATKAQPFAQGGSHD